MDEQTTIELGTFCEAVLTSNQFNSVWNEFEKTTFQQFLTTKPEDAQARERTYNLFNGAHLFLNYMRDIVIAKDKLLNAEPDDDPDNYEGIDC
jgi:hypothetical protein